MKGHLSSFYSSASIWLFLSFSLSSLPDFSSFSLSSLTVTIQGSGGTKFTHLKEVNSNFCFLNRKHQWRWFWIMKRREEGMETGDERVGKREREREGWGEWDVDGRLLTQEWTFFFPELLFFFVPCPSLFSRVKITTQLNNFCLSSSFSFFLSSSLLPFHSIPIFSHHLFHSLFSPSILQICPLGFQVVDPVLRSSFIKLVSSTKFPAYPPFPFPLLSILSPSPFFLLSRRLPSEKF